MRKLDLFLLLFTTSLFVQYIDGACTLPSDLSGDWHSSNKGELYINSTGSSTTIDSYPTTTFGTLPLLTCYLSSGNQYVFNSAPFNHHTLQWEVFLCIVIDKKITSKKYIYYLGSVENPDANGERLVAEPTQNAATPTVASICDRASYTAGSEHIFLKKDGNELSSTIDCPFSMRAKNWTYTFTSSGSITTYCSSASALHVCDEPGLKTMSFDYNECATVQAYSASGVVKCMYETSDSNYKYVHVYNTDATVDESTNYRFTCYVMSKTNARNMYMTQHPQLCLSTQTSTSVDSPGAKLVLNRAAQCPFDSSSTVISTASAVGVSLGIIFLVIIILCAALIWYYYKKRKEREAIDKLPLQRCHVANKKLTNGDLYRDAKRKDRHANGDVRVNIDTDPAIRRENSIHISMASRGGSGMGGLEGPEAPTPRIGPAPVEEPEQVNQIDEAILECENEAALASTFLPRTPDERTELHFTDAEIKEIERKDAEKRKQEEEEDNEFDMDEIDDELGLPRLSRAFTPVIQPEEATLPTIAYKKQLDDDTESDDEKRADGIKKVKLKKGQKKKRRVVSSLGGVRPKSSIKGRPSESFRETPFLDRIKKVDAEKVELEQREKIEKEMKQIENEVIKARLAKDAKESRAAPRDKYMVDRARSKRIQSTDKGALSATTASGERRRFGDPPTENTRKNRKRTPRLRHPMEIQADSEEVQEQEILKKAVEFWKEEKRARNDRKREHPEAVTIPSLKEEQSDTHREHRNPDSSAVSQARSGKSASGMRLERETSAAFIEPKKDPAENDDVWDKASSLWHTKLQPIWGNLAHH